MPESTEITPDGWWSRLRAAALVGTGRRPVPDITPLGVAGRAGSAEQRALDGAALGAALHRAGRLPARVQAPAAAAAPDRLPVAPPRAVQVLDLLLDQPPAGLGNTEALLRTWLEACAGSGHRVPHVRLPVLLGRGEHATALRQPLRAAIDERGRWLAARNPAWVWALTGGEDVVGEDGDVDPDAWALLPDAERAAALQRLRYRDADRGRELLLGTWATDPAKVRAAHLQALAIGLGTADTDVLESALDDRAGSVRAVAADLLDALPGSPRGSRMAERLRPLLHTTGLLGRGLEVALPDDPDPAAVRDGLGKPPAGRARRGWWLERIVAGAPFEVWGEDPGRVVRRLSQDDALAGLRRAAVRRHDAAWAEALLSTRPDPDLLHLLPAGRREQVVLGLLGATDRALLGPLLAAVPGPWSPDLSEAVVADLARRKHPYGHLDDLPLSRLHLAARPRLERWQARIPESSPTDKALRRSVRNLVQLHSLRETISEAFR